MTLMELRDRLTEKMNRDSRAFLLQVRIYDPHTDAWETITGFETNFVGATLDLFSDTDDEEGDYEA